MSHDATNWAIKQRGIKPALKVVLWNLCDRYHPDNGCFPSQDTLAADCEVPRSTLNVYLKELEDMGLIVREQRREKGSNRMDRTRYRFPFEPDFPAKTEEKPGPDSGHGPVSRNRPEPSPENGKSHVQNLDSNPVREPVKGTSKEREGGRDRQEGKQEAQTEVHAETPASIERAFWRLVKNWPDFDGMPKEPAKGPWLTLTQAERSEALAQLPAWLAALKRQKKSHVPAPSTYLREKLWQDIPISLDQQAGAKTAVTKLAAPYGKLWMAERIADLLRKPYGVIGGLTTFEKRQVQLNQKTADELYREKIRRSGWTLVNTMHERAADMKGYPCRPELMPLAESFRPAHRDGDLYAAWRREHERRGWPFIDNTRPPEWVHFPPVPDGWEADPDAAVWSALEEFAAQVREVRGDEHAA
ncbi:helix-turn-helix domain-containing protein [Shinella zoogloeoides]|uniref:helix-turn-helix domain-containing protein n=1 Tax=Shinella zoogloeoides TaxID=352475 RepID=UPI00273F1172|nr:helix-turn-helix domain-containing protein [Shinella zoogloeoides]WLR92927.1 helix-turn-helix domain-containing protein [Shinella zoogloeoides]